MNQLFTSAHVLNATAASNMLNSTMSELLLSPIVSFCLFLFCVSVTLCICYCLIVFTKGLLNGILSGQINFRSLFSQLEGNKDTTSENGKSSTLT